MPHDVMVSAEGSIAMVKPISAKAKSWFEENVEVEPHRWFAGACAVDQHTFPALMEGMHEAGLLVGVDR